MNYTPWEIRKDNMGELVERYFGLKEYGGSMYSEAMMQYRDMANGGDGGTLGFWPRDWPELAVRTGQPVEEPTCRSYNYPGYPDSFFVEVLMALDEY